MCKNMYELTLILQSLEECSFERWYSLFIKIAIPGSLIPIPDHVMNYLKDEIIILPKECYPEGRVDGGGDTIVEFLPPIRSHRNINEDEYNDVAADDADDDDDLVEPEFPEFSGQITKMIDNLWGGATFLKTRWHCPKDSFWITMGRTSKIVDITDVYQLLKASSIVKRDLFDYGLPDEYLKTIECPDCLQKRNEKLNDATGNFIVLKEWNEIHPATEFRCFVRRNNLIAISPRDWPNYHQFIDEHKNAIWSDIVTVFKEHIKMKFPLNNYTFDVIRWKKDNVLLLDFSPFHSCLTDSLAFEWAELTDDSRFLEEDSPEFRYLDQSYGIQPASSNNYGIPVDITNMFSEQPCNESIPDLNLAELLINRCDNAGV